MDAGPVRSITRDARRRRVASGYRPARAKGPSKPAAIPPPLRSGGAEPEFGDGTAMDTAPDSRVRVGAAGRAPRGRKTNDPR
jgi:hypothetical protein